MKKIKILSTVFFAVAMGLSVYAFEMGNDAPQKVKEAFAKKFPGVKKVKWDKENETEWEAEFKMKGTEYSANFLEDGTWKETEHEMSKMKIPSAIKNTLDAQFSGYEIEEAVITESREGWAYEFSIEKGDSEMQVVVDTDGKILKKVEKEDKADNEMD